MPDKGSKGKIGYASSVDFGANDILYMLKDLPDACCVFKVLTDPFGTVKDMMFLFANEKYAQLVDKPSAELVGNTFYKAVSNRDEDWIKFSYQAAILRQSAIMRTYNTKYDKWFEFWAVPVYQKGFCAYIIHDVTVTKKNEDNIAIAANTSNLVIECAKALSSAEFGKGIKKVLKIIGQALEADRVYIVETKGNEVIRRQEWLNDSGSPNLPSKKDFEKNDFITMWNKQLKDKDVVIVNDSLTVRPLNEAVYRDVLAGNVQRYIVSTLKDKKDIIGYLVVDNHTGALPYDIADVMESIAIFIAYELRNRALTSEMMYLGSHDELTGLGNRYSLNQTLMLMTEISTSVGVCYSDINGLKKINDELGHDEGDKLIKSVATVFASAFKRKYCYRIGGDEFIAVIPEIEKEKFEELVEKFRQKDKKTEVAVGSVWIKNSGEINKAVKLADEAMYKDKARFYESHERRKI